MMLFNVASDERYLETHKVTTVPFRMADLPSGIIFYLPEADWGRSLRLP